MGRLYRCCFENGFVPGRCFSRAAETPNTRGFQHLSTFRVPRIRTLKTALAGNPLKELSTFVLINPKQVSCQSGIHGLDVRSSSAVVCDLKRRRSPGLAPPGCQSISKNSIICGQYYANGAPWSSKESGSRVRDRNFSRAVLIVVLRAVHARAHRIFLHQGGIERVQKIHDTLVICNARI